MNRFNVRRGALVVFALAASTACGGDDPVAPGGGGGGGGGGVTPVVTTNVVVSNNEFTPPLIQVSPGAVVTWTYAAGSVAHNVNFTDASITDIPDQTSGAYTATMPVAPADYTYACTNHAGMAGTVRVQ